MESLPELFFICCTVDLFLWGRCSTWGPQELWTQCFVSCGSATCCLCFLWGGVGGGWWTFAVFTGTYNYSCLIMLWSLLLSASLPAGVSPKWQEDTKEKVRAILETLCEWLQMVSAAFTAPSHVICCEICHQHSTLKMLMDILIHCILTSVSALKTTLWMSFSFLHGFTTKKNQIIKLKRLIFHFVAIIKGY